MSRPARLVASTLPVARVDASTRDTMWSLLEAHYDDVTRERFDADLDAKDHVILLRSNGALRGFSTLQRLSGEVLGRPYRAVYSGDTVIDPAFHGQTALQVAFYRYVFTTRLMSPTVPLFWFLISKGYKTYLLLSRNFPEHWPRRDQATPPWQAAVLDDLATRKFGSAWHPVRGVLIFDPPAGRLRAGVSPVEPALDDPDVAFFVARNPGHARGDELCCLGRVDRNFALSYGWKALRKRLR